MMSQCFETSRTKQFHAKRPLQRSLIPVSLIGVSLCAVLLFVVMYSSNAIPATHTFAQHPGTYR
jgi:hypothetical protein